MKPAFNERIAGALEYRRQHDLARESKILTSLDEACIEFEGSRYVNFSSNDYLGLGRDKQLLEAWQHGLSLYGCGSGASPLVTGYSSAHADLESALCDWLGFERAILFSSGFSANQALIFGLLEKGDLLVQDKLNHASLMEAGLLSAADMKRFRHNDVQHLSSFLGKASNTLVMTEGVFSMDGDTAPLVDIQSACLDRAWLAVDDAHGIGVLGSDGRGSCDEAGIRPEILVVTFGKAFGLSGAAILCSQECGDYLTQFAKHHVYSTAIPPSQAYALTHAIGMIQTQNWRREKLAELQGVYQSKLSQVNGFVDTTTPIKPFILGDSERALTFSNYLKASGLWVAAIRPPTVATNSARLRVTLTANHTKEQVVNLSDAILENINKGY
ncbi:8-amino-7-oxononanoate synthase [Vibrio sp. SCSIO 43135]|uniref:8-amino-7-oxononanoate synthase n=1 Tax=Vibrio sp. SCSIO 43135 TaxID=2819096 RepID=UPI00207641A2|nr:8-amino-7-oxononanoate synthase [Vibrio sp. SCSIO 43135]USD40207.1 8-amino-7-oxononanoate synthase [Vibrio sp. SCSIO 43135]